METCHVAEHCKETNAYCKVGADVRATLTEYSSRHVQHLFLSDDNMSGGDDFSIHPPTQLGFLIIPRYWYDHPYNLAADFKHKF